MKHIEYRDPMRSWALGLALLLAAAPGAVAGGPSFPNDPLLCEPGLPSPLPLTSSSSINGPLAAVEAVAASSTSVSPRPRT